MSWGIFSGAAGCGSVNGCCGNCGWVVDVDGVVVSVRDLVWVVVAAATNFWEYGLSWQCPWGKEIEMVICVYPGILFTEIKAIYFVAKIYLLSCQ